MAKEAEKGGQPFRFMRRLNYEEAIALRAAAIRRGTEITVSNAGDHAYVMRRV